MTAALARLVGLLAAVGLAATMTLAPSSAPAQTAHRGTHLHARMSSNSSYRHCWGGAWYESGRGWREFEMTIHGISALNGRSVTVRVHGVLAGRMRVHGGYAHMHRHRGLPTMSAGSWVKVRTASGAVVSRGQLHRMHHGMM